MTKFYYLFYKEQDQELEKYYNLLFNCYSLLHKALDKEDIQTLLLCLSLLATKK